MIRYETSRLRWIRPLAWSAPATLTLLPLFVIKLADPRSWDIADLPFAFVMIGAVGLAFEFALRCPARLTYRAGALIATLVACLLIWSNLAVGFAGSEDNQINVIFFAVPALALFGSAVTGFRASGLAIAMAGTAIAHVAAGMIAFFYGYFTGPLTIAFTGLWLSSSVLFQRFSREIEAKGAPVGDHTDGGPDVDRGFVC